MKIYIDGKYYDRSDARVSVFDHGLLYGDGVFEGIRIYSGMIFKLKEHIERLYQSAKAILLEIPMSKEEMEKIVLKTVRINEKKNGYIRLVVTRGDGLLEIIPVIKIDGRVIGNGKPEAITQRLIKRFRKLLVA
jgi:branched-chain amino acid aminotransferase